MAMYRLVFVFLISGSVLALTAASSNDTSSSRPSPQSCILPEYPDHGAYVVLEGQTARPGQGFEAAVLNYTCQEGYESVGRNQIFCVSGKWSEPFPQCIRLCKLDKNPSMLYYCTTADGKRRDCDELEPSGAIVQPMCLYSDATNPLGPMTCIDGAWDYVATCSADCGKIFKEHGVPLSGNQNIMKNELPWHAGIYTKTTKPYRQLCGGTLVTSSVVLSAAHCFWSIDSIQPKEDYAVALGKIYRPWNNDHDNDAHQSDVKDIHIPPLFMGQRTNYQQDIAVVVMKQPVTYRQNIWPICLSFDSSLENMQLQHGTLGKIGGWNINSVNGDPSPVLKVVEVPYIDVSTCIEESPMLFRPYITGDKMCAGYNNGTTLCRGYSGAGLAFPTHDRGVERYYLRGIMSTAPFTKGCAPSIVTFTQISKHEHFLKQYIL